MTYVIEPDKDYTIYCLEAGCWTLHRLGPGRHRCERCREERRHQNNLHSMYHGSVRTRLCAWCKRRLPYECYHRDELIRKRPVCRECRESIDAEVGLTEFAQPAEPSSYAPSAPGRVWYE